MYKFSATHDGLEKDSWQYLAPEAVSPDGKIHSFTSDGQPLPNMPTIGVVGSWPAVSNTGMLIGSGVIDGVAQAFLYDHGQVIPLDDPNATTGTTGSIVFGNSDPQSYPYQATYAQNLNDAGDVVGDFQDAQHQAHGFLWNRAANSYQTVDYPGAAQTILTSVDDNLNVQGYWTSTPGPISGDATIHWFAASLDAFPQGTPAKFLVGDLTANTNQTLPGQNYSGPVSGLTDECIQISQDKLDITAFQQNSFIHTGYGDDAIDVSQCNGNNVLDGGTGSNFLSGGTGNDTFFLDDRNPAADIWSTLKGFHGGDNATVWGVTLQDFSSSLDNQGAAGATGLTLAFTKSGQPTANLTIAGYTTQDLHNGRLTMVVGHTQDIPGLPGSDFIQIIGH